MKRETHLFFVFVYLALSRKLHMCYSVIWLKINRRANLNITIFLNTKSTGVKVHQFLHLYSSLIWSIFWPFCGYKIYKFPRMLLVCLVRFHNHFRKDRFVYVYCSNAIRTGQLFHSERPGKLFWACTKQFSIRPNVLTNCQNPPGMSRTHLEPS